MAKKKEKVEDYEKAQELLRLTEDWQNKNFNHIQLTVYETMAEKEEQSLIEFIEADKVTIEDLAEYSGETVAKIKKAFGNDWKSHRDYDRVEEQKQQDNYPMWNTLFEFKYRNPGDKVLEAARNAGFGIIDGLYPFNETLFVAGAGYSFYGAHWIPMFLNLPWNESIKKKYGNIKIDHL